MGRFKKILIIIRRSNGDVFLTDPLVRELKEKYNADIDVLINKDTQMVAKLNPFFNRIFTYDYGWKGLKKYFNEIKLFWKIFKRYDLAINLTTNDRSTRYAIFSAKKSISVVDNEKRKNWWKKLLLTHYYYNENKHIILQNLIPLQFLQSIPKTIEVNSYYNKEVFDNLTEKYSFLKDKYIIFHPSAQYEYKIYPLHLRNTLLNLLNTLDIPIIITGGKSSVDLNIATSIPKLKNVYNLIGETSLEEFIAISDNSSCYIGMDTLNMHIAASQNKKIFAIFGPTNHQIWSPWCNKLQTYAKTKELNQRYGNINIFQANMDCVYCGLAGCDDKHGKSECLDYINPSEIFLKVKKWIVA